MEQIQISAFFKMLQKYTLHSSISTSIIFIFFTLKYFSLKIMEMNLHKQKLEQISRWFCLLDKINAARCEEKLFKYYSRAVELQNHCNKCKLQS